MKNKYIYFTILYMATIFVTIYFGDKFFTSGTEPGPSLFKFYADQVFSGKIPYHDFLFEYPPFALVFMLVPRLFSANFAFYQLAFWFELAFFGLLGLWMIIDLAKTKNSQTEEKIIPFIYLALLFVLGMINFSRYDLIPAIMTLGAVWLKLKNKPNLAYFILGLAVATKIYPAVILPLFLIHDFRNLKDAAKNIFFFIFGIFLSILPFIAHLGELKSFIVYQGARGVQLESLWANILMIKHAITGDGLKTIAEAGALGVEPYPKYFIMLSYLSMVSVLFVSYWLFRKRQNELILYSFLAILIFILFNRVFSPQFFVWVLVFFPLIYKDNLFGLILTGCFFLATFLTKLIYPNLYVEKALVDFRLPAVLILSARNFALFAIFVAILLKELRDRKTTK